MTVAYESAIRIDRVVRILLALLLTWGASTRARGAPGETAVPPGSGVRLKDVREGSLLFKTSAAGVYLPAPTLDTDVSIRVSGMIARAEVSQKFRNATGSCAEGIYVFPLPEGAAVDRLRLVVGGRIIEGEIRERAEAKKIYEEAKAEGKKASLVEQERPNVFTTSVAAIGDGEEVSVVLVYQETLRYEDGRFRLRFPMVVAPRYIPGTTVLASKSETQPGQSGQTEQSGPVETACQTSTGSGPDLRGAGGTGWAFDTDQVPDASRVTPPVMPPGHPGRNPIHVRLLLDAGLPLRGIKSGTHALAAKPSGTNGPGWLVTLSDEDVVADRDLELSWELDLGRDPSAAVFTQKMGGETYALLMVVPPAPESSGARLPRETVFVIDTSGSMHGTSIDGAKRALTLALSRLGSEDRFNVIEFNSVTHALYSESRRALPQAIEEAKAWVARLQAEGGTEMLPALRAALSGGGTEEPDLVRQVLFMTDGGVANEEALFRFIRENLGKSRLFTVGLGSAPNSHFMTKAAEFGRGTFTYVASAAEVEPKMSELFRKLESPVLTDLDVRWDDASAETWPAKVPDLYAGEPLVVAARLASAGGGVTVRGVRGSESWSRRVELSGAAEDSGVDRLWARRKISAFMDAMSGTSGAERDGFQAKVVAVALAHHLVSDFTSLVAVDVTPTAARGEACVPRPIPVHLPAGWSYEHVFGELPRTATPGRLFLILGFASLVAGLVLYRLGAGGEA